MRNVLRRQFLAQAASGVAGASAFDVRQAGAAGDGVHLDTKTIQEAIDACARAGGGTVHFPAGRYLSGTVVLKSHVALHLDSGAVLLGSRNLRDYPSHVPAVRSFTDTYTEKSLLYAEREEDIAIFGRGTIDGQGAAFQGPYKARPFLLRFVECRRVAVADIAFKDSPMWVQHYLGCDDVEIRGLTVRSRVNANNDGIDIDGCRGVRISDCDIWCGDDAIVLKSTLDRPSANVVVTNCVLSTLCNAIKLGTESNGGFENISISNCTIYDTRLAGIAIESVDGGALDRVSVSNVNMHGVGAPLFIRLGDRGRPFVEGGVRPPVGKLRNVSISNVQADGAGITGCAIAGLQGQAIENVTLENIRLSFVGGGTADAARREAPEDAGKYPEYSMFGVLPAYGFYCRYVNNLVMRDVETRFVQPDLRPALVCEHVESARLAGADFGCAPEAREAIRLAQCRGVLVSGCRASGTAQAWLRVGGERSRSISVIGNHLTEARLAVDIAPEVDRAAVFLDANRLPA